MKKVVIPLIIIVILAISFFIYKGIKEEEALSKEGMYIINENYNLLKENINNYNVIRQELNDKLNTFFYDKFLKEKESYEEILNKYNNVITEIDTNVEKINSKCKVIYKDKEVNKICNSYDTLYEKLINIYVKDLNNYNNKVTSYNENTNSNEELFIMIHNEEIDYNNDGSFEG